MKRSLALIGAFLVPLSVHADFSPSRAVTCENDADPSLIGYKYLDALYSDMQDEADRISQLNNETEVPSSYHMVLCPGNVFDTWVWGPIVPPLDNVTFTCGNDNTMEHGEECLVTGGDTQVHIQNINVPTRPEYGLNQVTFQGITFEGFMDTSVVLNARKSAIAIFESPKWRDFHGVSIMKTKPTDGKLNGMTVFISNSTVQTSENAVDMASVKNYFFRNNGGTFIIDGLVVDRVDAGQGIIRNSDGGTTYLSNVQVGNSKLGSVGTVKSGLLKVTNVVVKGNLGIKQGFWARSTDAEIDIDGLSVTGNSNPEHHWVGIHSVGGASVTVQNSRFEENRNMIWGVISETLAVNEESHVVLKDSIFGSNSEGAPISALVAASGLADTNIPAHLEMERVAFVENQGYTANLLTLHTTQLRWHETCHIDNDHDITVFLSAETFQEEQEQTGSHYVSSGETSLACPGTPASPIYQETEARSCFSEHDCVAECRSTGFDAPKCYLDSQDLGSSTQVDDGSDEVDGEEAMKSDVPSTAPSHMRADANPTASRGDFEDLGSSTQVDDGAGKLDFFADEEADEEEAMKSDVPSTAPTYMRADSSQAASQGQNYNDIFSSGHGETSEEGETDKDDSDSMKENNVSAEQSAAPSLRGSDTPSSVPTITTQPTHAPIARSIWSTGSESSGIGHGGNNRNHPSSFAPTTAHPTPAPTPAPSAGTLRPVAPTPVYNFAPFPIMRYDDSSSEEEEGDDSYRYRQQEIGAVKYAPGGEELVDEEEDSAFMLFHQGSSTAFWLLTASIIYLL